MMADLFKMYIPATGLLKRELLTTLRYKRTFAAMLFTALCTLGIIAFQLYIVAEQNQFYSEFSLVILVSYTLVMLIALILFIPPIASSSICQEKEQGTYDLLATSLLGPGMLVIAKLINVLTLYFLILIATLPGFGVIFFLVGIDTYQFLQSFLILVATALVVGPISLATSSFFYRPLAAMISSYIAILFYMGAAFFFMALVLEPLLPFVPALRSYRAPLEALILLTNPLAVLFHVYGITPTPVLGQYLLPGFLGTQIFIASASILFARTLLNRPPKPMLVNQDKPIEAPAQLHERRARFPFYLLDPRRRAKAISDRGNPFYAKDLRTSIFGQKSRAIRVLYLFGFANFAICLVLLVFLNMGTGDTTPLLAMIILIQTLILMPMVAVASTYLFTKEFELGNGDMLRATLSSTISIVVGKLAALVVMFSPFVGAAVFGPLAVLLACMMSGYPLRIDSPLVIALAYLSAFSTLALTAAICVYAAVRIQRNVAALMGALIGGFTLFTGLPFVVIFLLLTFWNDGQPPIPERNIEYITAFYPSPLRLMAFLFERESNLSYTLWLTNISIINFFAAFLLLLATIRLKLWKG